MQAFLGVLKGNEVTSANLPDLLSLACTYSSIETLKALVDLGVKLPRMKLLAGQTLTDAEAREAETAAVMSRLSRAGDPMEASASASCGSLWPDKAAWSDCMAELLESCVTQQAALKFRALLRLSACNAMGE